MSTYAAATAIKAAKRLNDPYRDNQGTQQNALVTALLKILNRLQNSLTGLNECTFVDGTTAGKIKILGGAEAIPVEFKIDGETFTKAPTDDFWNLAAQTDTPALEYAAFWLLIDSSGTASIDRASANAASAVLAKAVLLADGEPAADKAVLGCFVAGPSTDFSADAIVAVAGATMEYGFPGDMKNTFPVSLVTG
jgi:hypothetical protein